MQAYLKAEFGIEPFSIGLVRKADDNQPFSAAGLSSSGSIKLKVKLAGKFVVKLCMNSAQLHGILAIVRARHSRQ